VADPKSPAGLQGDRAGARTIPVGAGRHLWPMAGGVAALALLVLGVLAWMRGPEPGRGDAMAGKALRAEPGQRDLGRGPGPNEGPPPAATPGVVDRRAPGSPRRLSLLVPAYIFPTGAGRRQWRQLIEAAAKVDLVVIVNPASGPGAERNMDYASAIVEATERGVKLVGYVSTRYAERPEAEVKQDIDNWVRFYPQIAGFFLDQQPSGDRSQAYYAEVADYARKKLRGARVITNPGVPCDEIFLARRISDQVCVFANLEGFNAFELPAALKSYPSSRYAALVYQVADAQAMRSMVKEAIIKGIGYLYITDGKLPNPWAQLPAYWDAEVEAVMQLQ
jgi:hypothetical protein